MAKLHSIHHLRGIAALAVLLFHAFAFVAGYGNHSLTRDVLRIGEAGVDIFFVISGFVLTIVTQSPGSRAAFIVGRLIRVGVPYWLVTGALAVATLAAPAAFRSYDWKGADLLLSLAFVPSLIRDGSIFPLIEPGWTLSLEMLFYALLAAMLGFSSSRRALLVSAALCALAAAGLVLDLPQGQSLRWFYTQAVLTEFCFGIGLAQLYLSGWRPGLIMSASLLGFGLVGFATAAGYPPEPFEPARLLVYGLPAAALVSGAVFLEAAGQWGRNARLALLGDISYALYLTHVLVLAVMVKLLGGRFAGLGGDILMLFVALGAALIVAFAYHHLVEKPALRLSALAQARLRAAAPPALQFPINAEPQPERQP